MVHEGRVIARAWNQVETLKDATAHAEMLALTAAQAVMEDWRLDGCTLYVTKEPCPMCAGALVLGRLDRVVYGTDDPKTGAVRSLYQIVEDERLNHQLEVTRGVLQDECKKQLQAFFQRRREENSNTKQIQFFYSILMVFTCNSDVAVCMDCPITNFVVDSSDHRLT